MKTNIFLSPFILKNQALNQKRYKVNAQKEGHASPLAKAISCIIKQKESPWRFSKVTLSNNLW
ncbi:hypothetical protein BKI52_43410 [marine bacterium AO1-C]|nr:hypothetical protein BKI52_43410 [marine bacterium AO1-C]